MYGIVCPRCGEEYIGGTFLSDDQINCISQHKMCRSCYDSKQNDLFYRIALIIFCVILFGSLAMCQLLPSMVENSSKASGSSNATCAVCGRTFTDYDNMHSIHTRNMCVNCYNNYEFGMGITGRDANGNNLNGN